MGYCGVLLGDRGTAGGAAGGVLLGWGKRCWWGAAGRRRSFTGRWHQWQGLLGCCWALLGPQLGFLLIPCCSDWSADSLGKLDVDASEVVGDACPPLRGPRLEDQLPVAPVGNGGIGVASTLASITWCCRFEPLKHADRAFASRFADGSLHPATLAVVNACLCEECAVEAVPPALILVHQNIGAPACSPPRHSEWLPISPSSI